MRATWGVVLTALLAAAPAYAQDAIVVASPATAPKAEPAPPDGREPTSVFAAAMTEREPGWIPRFGVGEGMSLKLSGAVRGRAEHRYWTLEDTLPLFPGHDHDEHQVHTSSGPAHSTHGLADIDNEDTTHFELRTRFGGELTISSQWSVTLQLQHARLWSNERDTLDNYDHLDLYQGFVAYTLPGDTGWAVKAGRFSVPSFGDERIMSPNEWDTRGRALDGVAATWNADGLGITLLATNTGIADPVRSTYDDDDDVWFGGVAFEMREWAWLDVEFYALGRYYDRQYLGEEHTPHPPHAIRPGDDTGRRADVTLGTFVALKGGGVRLVGEVYGQLGRYGPDTVRAWASAERIEYTPWEGDWFGVPAPTLFFEHAFASGDKRTTDGVRNTFDPLFANYHDHLGPFDKLGYKNVNALAVGFSHSLGMFWERLRPITFTFVARGSFLASQNDAWYDAEGNAVLRDPTGDTASSRTLEGELSGWFTAEFLDGSLELSAGLAHWCPNNLLGDLNWEEHSYRFWFSTQVRF
ncbi:MAG: alginate export family protein [Planctomycetota bacterium]|jgi:hypothetical protein